MSDVLAAASALLASPDAADPSVLVFAAEIVRLSGVVAAEREESTRLKTALDAALLSRVRNQAPRP